MSFKKKESDPKGMSKKQQELVRNKTRKHIGKAKKKNLFIILKEYLICWFKKVQNEARIPWK